jgi:hypothetical protein
MEEPQRGKPGQGLTVSVTGDAAYEEFCGSGDEQGRPDELPTSRPSTSLTSHGQVLLAVARNPELRVRELQRGCQITERYARLTFIAKTIPWGSETRFAV